MRILLVNTLFPPIIKGGAEVSTSKLAAGLASRGHDIHVLTISPDTEGTSVEGGVTVHRIKPALVGFPYGRTDRGRLGKLFLHALDNYNPWMFRKCRKLIREIRPDVVHTNVLQLISGAVWRAAKAEAVPIVHNLRDYWLLCARSGFFRDGRNCGRNCGDCGAFTAPRRKMSGDADAVVAVGQHVLDTHLSAGLFGDVRVAKAILNATEPVTLSPKSGREGEIRLGFIGRIKESKGIRVLLEAMREVPASAGVKLILAGGGDEADMAEFEALADDRSKFIGWCDPADFYTQVDVVIIPSLYPEPLPRTALEAYRYGLPVIAAASGGTPEVVDHGKSGWLYDPENRTELAQLIVNLRSDVGLAAIEPSAIDRIVARTEPEFVVAEYEKVYQAVLG